MVNFGEQNFHFSCISDSLPACMEIAEVEAQQKQEVMRNQLSHTLFKWAYFSQCDCDNFFFVNQFATGPTRSTPCPTSWGRSSSPRWPSSASCSTWPPLWHSDTARSDCGGLSPTSSSFSTPLTGKQLLC